MASVPILVGASGSEQSLRAVDWATREAVLRSVPLRIVSVVPPEPGACWRTPRAAQSATLRQAATEALENAAVSASMSEPGLTIDTSLLTGDPGPVLARLHRLLEPWREKYPGVEVGEEIIHAHPGHVLAGLTATAGLLVLGRHAHPAGGTDAPLGSVTHAVLAHAHCPAVIVPEESSTD